MNRETFVKRAKQFHQHSLDCGDSWQLQEVFPSIANRQTLAAQTMLYLQRSPSPVQLPGVAEPVMIEHHIVYSPSYQSPVLYFVIYDRSGCSLFDNDLVQALLIAAATTPADIHGPTITIDDHPVLCRPFFYVHPCHTAKVMAHLYRSQVPLHDYSIASWLSVFGPLVKCRIHGIQNYI
jgi:hypothetical protein